ncbi:MAG TPA: hypothetical protein VIG25_09130 [Pyrinomonadaceae bacterium]|jgi:hypothetical protein
MPTPNSIDLYQNVGALRKPLFQSFHKALQRPLLRELLIILAFFALTSALTWPYISRMKDAVSGRNDPYLIAWTLWWDYHATFNDPLNLFHPPIFYPYRYALAFSEHCYGIALVMFPLFALGLRPLTVHSVAIFLGFVFSGYAAFRLARTLTQSSSIAWIAGIIFAFIPYRFNMLGQLMYLFSVWIPLLFEALILFLRGRSNKQALWLGVTFFMLGLSTVSWFLLSTIPFAAIAAILMTRHRLWREREIWRRGAIALGIASLALMPFLLPYFMASRLYGFKRRVDEVKAHSALPIHWLVADGRSKFWGGMGGSFPDAWKFQMFPGVLPLLFPLAEFFLIGHPKIVAPTDDDRTRNLNWIQALDALIVICFFVSVLALGFDGSEAFGKFFRYVTSERVLSLLSIAVLTRLCLAYPRVLRRGEGRNLIETIQSQRRSDAFWVGLTLTIIGFLYSLGYNTFFYRILYDLMPGFKSMRAPMRGAIFAYLGLSILAGLGVKRIAQRVRWHWLKPTTIYVIACLMLLVELNGAPLYFIRGEVYPDQLTLRLKDTPMSGGIAYLPMTLDLNHQYTLRQADHLKPLITATSSFNPPDAEAIERMTASGAIPEKLMDLLEKIPASYLVVMNRLVPPERRSDFAVFVATQVSRGRLRFVNRFDEANDLYAVTATEPQAKSERALPEELNLRDWSSLVERNPLEILSKQNWSETIYRVHIVSFGKLPRYADFMKDVKSVGNGVLPGFERQELNFRESLRQFTEEFTRRPQFTIVYRDLSDAQFVDRLLANAGLQLDQSEHDRLVDKLARHQDTRAGVLLEIVNNPYFVEKEHTKAIVLLHYFAFLRRNPEDPPDHNLDGFNFWVDDVARNGSTEKIYSAFKQSIEYERLNQSR